MVRPKPKSSSTDALHLGDLRPLNPNARKRTERGAAMIVDSLQRFGAARSIVIDEDNVVLAGNGTTDAAGVAGIERVRVVEGDGNELIAVRRRGLSAEQKAALALADNRTAEVAEWDTAVLEQLAAELPDVTKGLWSADELKELLAENGGAQTEVDAEPQIDRAQELQAVWQTQRGQLWQLGEHRLLCGDSTKAEDVARLMGGEKAGVMNTDPPYGVAYANADRPHPGVAKPRVANDTLQDEKLQEFLEAAFRAAVAHALLPTAAWYMWHAHLTQGFFAAAAAAANVILSRQIIWVKPVLLLTRGQYHWKHEPCFFGWVKGNEPPDYGLGAGERTQTTIWEIDSVSHKEREELGHSTPKPVELFRIPIVKHLKPGEVCYEPFCGSGPQIVAAEQTGRRCYAIDIDPGFIAVCLQRYQDATGKTPVLLEP